MCDGTVENFLIRLFDEIYYEKKENFEKKKKFKMGL